MSNIYDTAYELEKSLREVDVFKSLAVAYNEMTADGEASSLFKEFRDIQVNLQQKQMTGGEITEEDITNAQAIAEKASTNTIIQKMMEKEQQLSKMMEEINGIITKPLQELYSSLDK
ncbi:Hypothetical protein Tpal_1480 [Trichococcus palustris]|jgi:cell fate (sporulation/competence/biofilm development) regulator YlbF (YheA/YmcA/DUF963 family)|uniref:UPF0342 protein Tpal_1480 n=1 Tax=Trichococcus palustris TaxID=140314 RepID=A0A143YJ72_9LACT|nr:YlbF family regulator [Trichococcus palustris]CZQ91898.1 Hypothetical protein Tpal_1480 [Trichococcus palustris]SFL04488.1 Cell fate regulator YlbF, YheA/YmcA/DUF963 family (controls sporulation, competence, biofilm development) [Trichococcus palustris]